jgi:predicted PurR-regulated permease PerM
MNHASTSTEHPSDIAETTDNAAQNKNTVSTKNDKPVRFEPNSRYFTILCYALLFVLGSIIIYKFIGNFGETLSAVGYFIHLVSEFLIGAFIALVLFPLVKFLYRKFFIGVLHIKSQKAARYLAIFCTYVIAVGLLILLFAVVIPQIIKSVTEITEQLPVWYNSIIAFIENFETEHPSLSETLDYFKINERIEQALPEAINYVTKMLTNIAPMVVTTSVAIVKGLISFIIAIIVSVYMISDHKQLFYHGQRLMYALMPAKTVNLIKEVLKESANIFIGFILGKALDSLIIGIICFVLMMIFQFPYAVLISVIVGITNMIPYFGPYFGGAIGFLFVLINSPIKALFFVLLILVIQQFDGLYLGPKILGNSTGLSPLWVIFAITVGGSLFGVLGMFLGVPCVAVISYILNRIISHLLNKKHVSVPSCDSQDRM